MKLIRYPLISMILFIIGFVLLYYVTVGTLVYLKTSGQKIEKVYENKTFK